MPVKYYKPTTNGRRNMSVLSYEELSQGNAPEKSLCVSLKKNSGHNNLGRVTVRHKGGASRRQYRIIDFKRDKDGVQGKIASIEYDPNRSANIALVVYADGEKRYIIAPKDIKVGDTILSADSCDIITGNCMQLQNIPVGTMIHNIELNPKHGAQLVRAAGASAQILGREDKYVLVRLSSGEVRKVLGVCRATIGTVGNIDHELVNVGKAGRTRHMGIRPTVRGSVMNPNDHPHGGGEGRQPVGRKAPMTPWGKIAIGLKTRNPKKKSNALIVHRRTN